MINGTHADYLPNWYESTITIVFPGDRYITPVYDAYGTGPDMWGVKWTNLGPSPGIDGSMVAKGFRLFNTVEDWSNHVVFPDYSKIPLDLILNKMKEAMGYDKNIHYLQLAFLSGAFERLNQMIGMEEALASFYDFPDETHEYFDAFCNFRIKCIEMAYDVVQPDCIAMQDDWGANNNMLFSPGIWREFINYN